MASFSPPAHRPSLGLSLDLDDVLSSWEEAGTGSIFAADFDACCYDRSGSNLSNSDLLYQHWDEPDADRLLDLSGVQASLANPAPAVAPKIDIMPFLMQQQQQPRAGMIPAARDSFMLDPPQLPTGFPVAGARSSFGNLTHTMGSLSQPSGGGMNSIPALKLPLHNGSIGTVGNGMVPSPFGNSSSSSTHMNTAFNPAHMALRPQMPHSDSVVPNFNPMAQQQQQQLHMLGFHQTIHALPGGAWSGNAPNAWDVHGSSLPDLRRVPNQQHIMMPSGGSFMKAESMPAMTNYDPSRQIQAVPAQPGLAREGRMSNDVPAHLKLQHLKKEPQNSCTSSSSTELSTMSESVLHVSTRSRNTATHGLDIRCAPLQLPQPGSAMSVPLSQVSTVLNLAMPGPGSEIAHNSGCGTPTTSSSPSALHSFAMRAAAAPPNSPAGTAAHQLASRLCLTSCSSDPMAPQGLSPLGTQLTVRPPGMDGLAGAASPAVLRAGTPAPARLPEVVVPPAADLCLVQQQPTLDLSNTVGAPTHTEQESPFSHMPVDWVRIRTHALERYREKRARRAYTKKIRYQLRKINADRRPRIKGRFVKKEELHLYAHLIKRGKGAPADDEPCEGSCNQPTADDDLMGEDDDAGFGVVPEFGDDPMTCVTGLGRATEYPMDLKLDMDGMVPAFDNTLVGW